MYTTHESNNRLLCVGLVISEEQAIVKRLSNVDLAFYMPAH